MPKYLFYGSYTPEGFEGLMEEGGSRRIEAAKQALESVGGSLEAFYFSFGENDFYILVDLPDNVTTAAVTFAGNVSGTFSINGVALLTAEELDEAIKKSVDFRPPGHQSIQHWAVPCQALLDRGGIPNTILSFQTPDDVRAYAKKVIDGVAQDGGYIMDAGAIMQNDTSIENMRALTDFTRDSGVYSSGSSQPVEANPTITPAQDAVFGSDYGMPEYPNAKVKAGVCIPWEEKLKELLTITGDRELVQRVWEEIDALGNMFIWQCLLSF